MFSLTVSSTVINICVIVLSHLECIIVVLPPSTPSSSMPPRRSSSSSSEGSSRSRPNMSVTKFWDAVSANTHSTSQGSPTIKQDPRRRRPRPWWVIISFLRLCIEACRWLIIPLLGLAPILMRPFTLPALIVCLVLATYLVVTGDRYRPNGKATPGIEGHTEGTQFGKLIEELLESRARAFKPTPYAAINGHLATAIPYLTYRYKKPNLKRRWMYTIDGQSVALDWCLPPPTGNVKGIVIVLAGINGSSTESYVCDLIEKATSQGYAVCCLISRGACGTTVVGGPEEEPCGSRVSDVEQVINICHDVVTGSSSSLLPVSMIGYSLGGIMATNSVARLGSKLKGKLNSCVSISGEIRVYEKYDFPASVELWQPLIAYELKRTLLDHSIERSGFKPLDPNWYDNIKTVNDIDKEIIAPSHGFKDCIQYYHNMSALSPLSNNKGKDIAIPTLCVHAYDDPIIHVDSSALLPVDTSRYLFTFVTPSGGHIGWPQGWLPWTNGFAWVSDTALSFMNMVACNTTAVDKHGLAGI